MTATISDLRRALAAPATHFRRIGDIVCADACISRTSYFAEAAVTRHGCRYTLYMPLSAASMARVERFAPLRRNLSSPAVPRMEILCDEMSYEDALQRRLTCDILIETRPQGRPLADALAAVGDNGDAAALMAAVDALERELRRADVSHNNLRVENILIDDDGALYPIRWIYAAHGAGGDTAALDAIRTKIASLGGGDYAGDPDFAPYAAGFDEQHTVQNLSDGLAAVETEQGWGFVDSEGRMVIEARYAWANGFREGRAEVQTATGMGLIDKQGRYIIKPRFGIVEYDPATGNSQVKLGEKWALFDYSGRQITRFADTVPSL